MLGNCHLPESLPCSVFPFALALVSHCCCLRMLRMPDLRREWAGLAGVEEVFSRALARLDQQSPRQQGESEHGARHVSSRNHAVQSSALSEVGTRGQEGMECSWRPLPRRIVLRSCLLDPLQRQGGQQAHHVQQVQQEQQAQQEQQEQHPWTWLDLVTQLQSCFTTRQCFACALCHESELARKQKKHNTNTLCCVQVNANDTVRSRLWMDCEEVAKVESALEDGSEQEPCEDGSEKGSSEHSDTPPLDASLYPLHLRVSLARARGLSHHRRRQDGGKGRFGVSRGALTMVCHSSRSN